MKKYYLLGIISGIILTLTIGVGASTLLGANNISYDNTTSNLTSVNTQNAIDELYNKSISGKNGIITALSGKGFSISSSASYDDIVSTINGIDNSTAYIRVYMRMASIDSSGGWCYGLWGAYVNGAWTENIMISGTPSGWSNVSALNGVVTGSWRNVSQYWLHFNVPCVTSDGVYHEAGYEMGMGYTNPTSSNSAMVYVKLADTPI